MLHLFENAFFFSVCFDLLSYLDGVFTCKTSFLKMLSQVDKFENVFSVKTDVIEKDDTFSHVTHIVKIDTVMYNTACYVLFILSCEDKCYCLVAT